MRIEDWSIDHSAGRPILTYKGCSVIEAEDAQFVLRAVEAALSTEDDPVVTSYVLTESLMEAIHLAATSRPTTIDVLSSLHAELDKNKPPRAAKMEEKA